MTIASRLRVTAYDWVPSFAQGQVRDMRVRWACEGAGIPYEAIILPQGSQRDPENLARQPIGQVPAIEIDGGTMFESGAIVWTIAEDSDTLLPGGRDDRRRCLSWLFAAINTIEPGLMNLAEVDFFTTDEEVKTRRRPEVLKEIDGRLGRLRDALGDRDYLVGDRFTVADLMMTAVLGMTRHTDILDGFPPLARYVSRHTGRPAYGRALAAQKRPFEENAAKYEKAA